ncbi:hypothetical protein F2Q69_00030327 [Brassica cretica]|uniref:Uncharacterized protein n=1 Tax=Brassica cretica TaxID=69181 RepID=A0A8S9S4W3_BRACR|nr:hypothetical protein F2Q69_00030327 [Brassica cretica]
MFYESLTDSGSIKSFESQSKSGSGERPASRRACSRRNLLVFPSVKAVRILVLEERTVINGGFAIGVKARSCGGEAWLTGFELRRNEGVGGGAQAVSRVGDGQAEASVDAWRADDEISTRVPAP